MEAGGDAEQGDHLADACSALRRLPAARASLSLAAVLGELGPVERPGLLDGVRLDPAGELGVLVDQLEADRTLGGPVGMVLDRRPGLAVLGRKMLERADFQLEAFLPPLLDLAAPMGGQVLCGVGLDPGADPEDDDGDVVGPAAEVGQVDQVAAGVLGVEVAGEGAELGVVDRARRGRRSRAGRRRPARRPGGPRCRPRRWGRGRGSG